MTYNPVDRPSHYAEGRAFEVIDILEDWAKRAPDPVKGGLYWNSTKYLGRLWDKENPLQDAKKARWYLDRLISKLEEEETKVSPYAVTYEDVLEDYAACAVRGEELVAEYGVEEDKGVTVARLAKDLRISEKEVVNLCEYYSYPVNSWLSVVNDATAEKIRGSVGLDVDDQPLAHWDSDDDYMWDPTLGPVELSEEEIKRIQDRKDLTQFDEDEIISIKERRGLLIGVKRDGSTCLLNDRGVCQ